MPVIWSVPKENLFQLDDTKIEAKIQEKDWREYFSQEEIETAFEQINKGMDPTEAEEKEEESDSDPSEDNFDKKEIQELFEVLIPNKTKAINQLNKTQTTKMQAIPFTENKKVNTYQNTPEKTIPKKIALPWQNHITQCPSLIVASKSTWKPKAFVREENSASKIRMRHCKANPSWLQVKGVSSESNNGKVNLPKTNNCLTYRQKSSRSLYKSDLPGLQKPIDSSALFQKVCYPINCGKTPETKPMSVNLRLLDHTPQLTKESKKLEILEKSLNSIKKSANKSQSTSPRNKANRFHDEVPNGHIPSKIREMIKMLHGKHQMSMPDKHHSRYSSLNSVSKTKLGFF